MPCRAITFTVSFWYPTNGEAYVAPATIGLHALATDSNVIRTMQYFSGTNRLGTVTNSGGVLLTNMSQDSPFYMGWSNVLAGGYTLTAVAKDSAGVMATSPPVNITVSNVPPPVILPTTYIFSPTNTAKFLAPANLTLYARAAETGGQVASVQFFANSNSLGVVSSGSQMVFTNISTEPLYPLAWSNVVAGSYALQVVATDTNGNTATSSVVSINIVTNSPPPPVPFAVSFAYPTNSQVFAAPAVIGVHAVVTDSNVVETIQYIANNATIGVVTNASGVLLTNISQANPFFLSWSNVLAGGYTLFAVAMDSSGATATSAPVKIAVTNLPPPVVPYAVSLAYPKNGGIFTAPANIYVHASVTDSNVVKKVQYFANDGSIGIVSNTSSVLLTNSSQANPFAMTWSNVDAGSYTVIALATDSAGIMATSAPVNITVTTNPPPVVPFALGLFYPTNGQSFTAPAGIYVHASVADSNVVKKVQYFANSGSIGVVSNTSGVLLTNTSQSNPFAMTWSNVPAGSYTLIALATDSAGLMTTSAPVNITVNTNPPPVVPFTLSFAYPANGQSFSAPANIYVHARVSDSNIVRSIQYFANGGSIGIVSNAGSVLLTNTSESNPFYLTWSNVAAGSYTLTALATDGAGIIATSAPVTISVTNIPPPVIPFAVSFWYPTNGQLFAAPAAIGVHARVTDSNVVKSVQYFASGTSIGVVSNTSGVLLTNSSEANPFFLSWSNVPAGVYTLTAVVSDNAGKTATSGPVQVYVLTNLPPVVTIYAPDPVAIAGTNLGGLYAPATAVTNYITGNNTATFLILRDSQTNTDLTVTYAVSGTAINGEDYETIPNSIVIPAGQRYSLVTIVPLNDTNSSYPYYDTVLLTLASPTNLPPAYTTGSLNSAGAVILDDNFLPISQPLIHAMADNSIHVSLPGTNGMNFSLQVSSDLVNWTAVCTNTVLKGSAQYVDPNQTPGAGLYYRIVPVGAPASY